MECNGSTLPRGIIFWGQKMQYLPKSEHALTTPVLSGACLPSGPAPRFLPRSDSPDGNTARKTKSMTPYAPTIFNRLCRKPLQHWRIKWALCSALFPGKSAAIEGGQPVYRVDRHCAFQPNFHGKRNVFGTSTAGGGMDDNPWPRRRRLPTTC